MGSKTGISWATSTWNPVLGCTPVSRGCVNCYAKRHITRFPYMTGWDFDPEYQGQHGGEDGTPNGWTGRAHMMRNKLKVPVRWKKPKNIFVVSMGDLFHKDVEESFLIEVYETIVEAWWHHYFVLTKRERRMREFLEEHSKYKELLNVHHGVSVCVEDEMSKVDVLLSIEGIRRFISFEPLLELPRRIGAEFYGIEFSIIGGESGPGARRFPVEGSKAFMDELSRYGCKVFFKQFGAVVAKEMGLKSKKGDKIDEWPEEFRVQEYPETGIQVF